MHINYSHLNRKAEITRKIIVAIIRTNILFIISIKPAPSSMIFLAPSIKCVIGNILDAVCIAFGVPSREKKIPDKNIMGQMIRLIIPPPASSLLILVENNNPREIWHKIEIEVIKIRSI